MQGPALSKSRSWVLDRLIVPVQGSIVSLIGRYYKTCMQVVVIRTIQILPDRLIKLPKQATLLKRNGLYDFVSKHKIQKEFRDQCECKKRIEDCGLGCLSALQKRKLFV